MPSVLRLMIGLFFLAIAAVFAQSDNPPSDVRPSWISFTSRSACSPSSSPSAAGMPAA